MTKDISTITLNRETGFEQITAYQVKNMVSYILSKLPECSLIVEIQKTNNTRYEFSIENISSAPDGYIRFAMYEMRHFIYRIISNLDESIVFKLFDISSLTKFDNSYLGEIIEAFNSNIIFKEYFKPFQDISMSKPFYSYSKDDKFNSLFHVSPEYVNSYSSALIKNGSDEFMNFDFKQLIHAFIKDDLTMTYVNTFHIGDTVIFFDIESNTNYIVDRHYFKEYKAIYSREEMFKCRKFERSDIDFILKDLVVTRLNHGLCQSVDMNVKMSNESFMQSLDLLSMTVY